MSVILNIDTATEIANVSIAKNGIVLESISNENQKDHAAFLQPAIHLLLSKNKISIHELVAIAVVNGPGSYTGLRVAMASAKGLSYALSKPLITVNTLELMAASAIALGDKNPIGAIFCPMIDARRMEVFTALYNANLQLQLDPCAMVINESSFAEQLSQQPIIFFGNGSEKLKPVIKHADALFMSISADVTVLSEKTYGLYQQEKFTDLAYSEPFYIKAFYSTQKGQQY
ncbi:MAG: tRNA (adenosine(37)-N6)-threonylcarbamoyltransferase complex dimerization subunit type 1 TsaB [Ferruginibacter sp.]